MTAELDGEHLDETVFGPPVHAVEPHDHDHLPGVALLPGMQHAHAHYHDGDARTHLHMHGHPVTDQGKP